MAEKAKNNKGLIIGICVAVVAVIAIIIGVVLATSGNKGTALGDNFFVTDGTKYVFTEESDSDTDEGTGVVKSHEVFYYADGKVTGEELYFEFTDKASAEAALELYQAAFLGDDSEFESIAVNGKYIVLVAKPSAYEEVTLEQLELIKNLSEMDYSDYDEEEDADTEEVEILDDEDSTEEEE